MLVMTGPSEAREIRVLLPTPIYAAVPRAAMAGSIAPEVVAMAPAGARLRDVEPASPGWLRICVTLGGQNTCGFVETVRTNYSPEDRASPVPPPVNSGQ